MLEKQSFLQILFGKYNTHKKLILISVVVILLIILLLILIFSNKTKTANEIKTSTISAQKQATGTSKPNEVAQQTTNSEEKSQADNPEDRSKEKFEVSTEKNGWKKLLNTTARYEINFPSNWEVTDENTQGLILHRETDSENYYEEKIARINIVKDFIGGWCGVNGCTPTKVTLGGRTWDKYEDTSKPLQGDEIYYYKEQNLLDEKNLVIFVKLHDENSIINQILSTFKFLE